LDLKEPPKSDNLNTICYELFSLDLLSSIFLKTKIFDNFKSYNMIPYSIMHFIQKRIFKSIKNN